MSIKEDLQKAIEITFSLEALLTEGFTEIWEGDDLFLEILQLRKKVTEIKSGLCKIEERIARVN